MRIPSGAPRWHGVPVDLASSAQVGAFCEQLNTLLGALGLVYLWGWEMRQGPGPHSHAVVEQRGAQWKGKKGAFVEAGIAAGFLRPVDDGLMIVPWWEVIRVEWSHEEQPEEVPESTPASKPKRGESQTKAAIRMRERRASKKGARTGDRAHEGTNEPVNVPEIVREQTENVHARSKNVHGRSDSTARARTETQTQKEIETPGESKDPAAAQPVEQGQATTMGTPGGSVLPLLRGIDGGKARPPEPAPLATPIGPKRARAKANDVVEPTGEAGIVWRHYQATVSPTSRCTKNREELITDCLRAYSVDDLKRCIDGYHTSPFHNGENEQGKQYLTIELFFRDSKHIEDGMAMLNARPRPPKRSAVPHNRDDVNEAFRDEYERKFGPGSFDRDTA